MLRIPDRSGPDPAATAWSKVACYVGKLTEALESLETAGGACKVAASARWGPEAHDRAMGQLLAVVEGLEAELGRLEMRRRHFPTRARRLG